MQKISIFANNHYCIGIDYSKQEKCLGVFDITEDEIEKLNKGCSLEIIKGTLKIIETEVYILKIKQEKINKINGKFNLNIQKYNSKYSEEDQKRFTDKLIKAEKVIAGGEDRYLTAMGKLKGISTLDYAKAIIQKAGLFEEFIIKAETERDLEISKL